VPHPGPASTAELAGRTSGTEHSVPRRYTSLAMRILRRVVRTPSGPRFHAGGAGPVTFTPRRKRRRDSPAGWPWPRKVTARETSRPTRRGYIQRPPGSGRITTGDAGPGAQPASPMAVVLVMPPVSPVTRTDFPAMRGA
jgi:hypothetical protein